MTSQPQANAVREQLHKALRGLDRMRREKGEALELLGPQGGAAAGLLPAIHNLAGERDRYKRQAEQLAEALDEVLGFTHPVSGSDHDAEEKAERTLANFREQKGRL